MSVITLATNNPHKVKMLGWVVEDFFADIRQQDSKIDVDETADSFMGNAELKAIELSKHTKSYAIATDGGILIPSLGKNWNALLTRRFLGKENVTDKDRIEGLLDLMKDKRGDDRSMVWHEAVALAHKGNFLFSKEVEGDHSRVQEVYNPNQYKEGIWLCTLTSYPQFGGKNFFELNDEEREYAEISWHRIKDAITKFLENHPPIKSQRCL